MDAVPGAEGLVRIRGGRIRRLNRRCVGSVVSVEGAGGGNRGADEATDDGRMFLFVL